MRRRVPQQRDEQEDARIHADDPDDGRSEGRQAQRHPAALYTASHYLPCGRATTGRLRWPPLPTARTANTTLSFERLSVMRVTFPAGSTFSQSAAVVGRHS